MLRPRRFSSSFYYGRGRRSTVVMLYWVISTPSEATVGRPMDGDAPRLTSPAPGVNMSCHANAAQPDSDTAPTRAHGTHRVVAR